MNRKMLVILVIAAVLIAAASTVVALGMNNTKTPGDVIKIKVGEVARIMLEENPSTGYMWAVEDSGSGIVETVGDYYAEGLAIPGAAVQHIWKVKGISKGETEIVKGSEQSLAAVDTPHDLTLPGAINSQRLLLIGANSVLAAFAPRG